MRVVITGATGFIGKDLCQELAKNYEIAALSRNAEKARKSLGQLAAVVHWDGKSAAGLRERGDGPRDGLRIVTADNGGPGSMFEVER